MSRLGGGVPVQERCSGNLVGVVACVALISIGILAVWGPPERRTLPSAAVARPDSSVVVDEGEVISEASYRAWIQTGGLSALSYMDRDPRPDELRIAALAAEMLPAVRRELTWKKRVKLLALELCLERNGDTKAYLEAGRQFAKRLLPLVLEGEPEPSDQEIRKAVAWLVRANPRRHYIAPAGTP